jgi:hypothetical protein
MSSHHFVREGQEPALFIVDPIPLAPIEPLLEWAPFVLVTDAALDQVISWGIKIDAVLVLSERTAEAAQTISVQEPVTVLSYHASESMLKTGLQYLMDQRQRFVNILATDPDAVFQRIAGMPISLQVNVLDGRRKWSGIPSGTFAKWVPAQTRFWIKESAIGQHIHFQGLMDQGDSLVTKDHGAVSFHSGQFFWLGEEYP